MSCVGKSKTIGKPLTNENVLSSAHFTHVFHDVFGKHFSGHVKRRARDHHFIGQFDSQWHWLGEEGANESGAISDACDCVDLFVLWVVAA